MATKPKPKPTPKKGPPFITARVHSRVATLVHEIRKLGNVDVGGYAFQLSSMRCIGSGAPTATLVLYVVLVRLTQPSPRGVPAKVRTNLGDVSGKVGKLLRRARSLTPQEWNDLVFQVRNALAMTIASRFKGEPGRALRGRYTHHTTKSPTLDVSTPRRDATPLGDAPRKSHVFTREDVHVVASSRTLLHPWSGELPNGEEVRFKPETAHVSEGALLDCSVIVPVSIKHAGSYHSFTWSTKIAIKVSELEAAARSWRHPGARHSALALAARSILVEAAERRCAELAHKHYGIGERPVRPAVETATQERPAVETATQEPFQHGRWDMFQAETVLGRFELTPTKWERYDQSKSETTIYIVELRTQPERLTPECPLLGKLSVRVEYNAVSESARSEDAIAEAVVSRMRETARVVAKRTAEDAKSEQRVYTSPPAPTESERRELAMLIWAHGKSDVTPDDAWAIADEFLGAPVPAPALMQRAAKIKPSAQ